MQNSIGALWKKTSKNGKTYYSGELMINEQKIKIICFDNKKDSEKHPDIKIYLSEPRSVQEQIVQPEQTTLNPF